MPSPSGNSPDVDHPAPAAVRSLFDKPNLGNALRSVGLLRLRSPIGRGGVQVIDASGELPDVTQTGHESPWNAF